MSDGKQITFKVNGSEAISAFESIKRKGTEMTNSFIANAQIEAKTAKEQVKLIEDQIKALEKKNILAAQIARNAGEVNVRERLANSNNRTQLFDDLRGKNLERLRSKEITGSEYAERNKRIFGLEQQNSTYGTISSYQAFAQKQTDLYKEVALANKIAREQVNAIKDGAKETVSSVKAGDEKIEDVLGKAGTPSESLAARLAKERLEQEERINGNSRERISGRGGIELRDLANLATGALGLGMVNQLIRSQGIVNSTQNGFDILAAKKTQTGEIVGALTGAVAGGIAAALTGGAALPLIGGGAALGGSLGGSLAGNEGSLQQRRALAMQEYLGTRNKYFATTGANSLATYNMAAYGLSDREHIGNITEVARLMGSNRNSEREAMSRTFLERGYGVESSTSSAILELLRSSREENRNVDALVAGIMKQGQNSYFRGGDNTFLNELLSKYTQLQKTLLQSNTSVNSGTSYGLLNAFNNVGGAFSTRDSRSLPLVEQVNNSLAHPSGDAAKGALFLALRREMPGASSYELLKEQQKGLASDKYRKAAFGIVDQMGGSEDFKKFNFAGLTGMSNKLEFSEQLYKHRNDPDFLKKYGNIEDNAADLSGKAKAYTTPLQSNAAEIQNGLLKNVYDSVDAMEKAFDVAVNRVADKLLIVANGQGKYELQERKVEENSASKIPVYTTPVGVFYNPFKK